MKIYKDRDWLWEHYKVRGESSIIMAREAGCSYGTILNWLHEMNIPVRGRYRGENVAARSYLYRNRDYMHNAYVLQCKSTRQIGDEIGIPERTIAMWLRRLNIPTRIANARLHKDYNWLRGQYIEKGKSAVIIAKEIGCTHATICKWLREMNIPVRSCADGIFLAKKNSLILSPQLLELLEGELLGDGSLAMPGVRSAWYGHASKYREYLVWLSGQFAALGLEQVGKIRKRRDKRIEFHGAISYQYESRSYPELVNICKRWYRGKKKIVPEDLRLTPIMARQWYIGDGCLAHHKPYRPDITLATCDFDKQSVEYLVKELRKLGFKATRRPARNIIGLSVDSVQGFLAWIGPSPIPCYDYKWQCLEGDNL